MERREETAEEQGVGHIKIEAKTQDPRPDSKHPVIADWARSFHIGLWIMPTE